MVAILANMAILVKMTNSREIAELVQITSTHEWQSAMVAILANMAILVNMANSRQIAKPISVI